MANLSTLRVFLTADTKKYNRGMTKAQLTARKFGSAIKDASVVMLGFTGVAAGAFAVLDRMATAGDDIGKGAKKIGVTAEEYQKLGFAARRSGADIANVATAFKRMASVILDAENGLTENVRSLKMLGLQFSDLKGRKPEEQFRIIAGRLNQVADASRKAALAQDFFGKSGTELIPMIANYAQLAKEAEQVGIITDANIAAAEKYKDEMEDLGTAIEASVVNSGLLPWLTEVIDKYQYIRRLRDAFGDGDHSVAAPTQRERRLQRELAASRRRAAEQAKITAEEKKYAGIAEEARRATVARFELSKKLLNVENKGFKQFQQLFDMFRGDLPVGSMEEFVDMQAKAMTENVADTRRTESRLASALQAGSREAFGLRVRGSDAQKMKVDKNNLKANEIAATTLEVIAARGVKLDGVAVVNSIG